MDVACNAVVELCSAREMSMDNNEVQEMWKMMSYMVTDIAESASTRKDGAVAFGAHC